MSTVGTARPAKQRQHAPRHDFRPGDVVAVSGVWPNWSQVREMLLAGCDIAPNIYFDADRLTHAVPGEAPGPDDPPLLVVTGAVQGRPLRCKVLR